MMYLNHPAMDDARGLTINITDYNNTKSASGNKNNFADSGIDMEFDDKPDDDPYNLENVEIMSETWEKPNQSDNENITPTTIESSGSSKTDNDTYCNTYDFESYIKTKSTVSATIGNETYCNEYDFESYVKSRSAGSSNLDNDTYSSVYDFESYIKRQFELEQAKNDKSEENWFQQDRYFTKIAQVPFDRNTGGELAYTSYDKCYKRFKEEGDDNMNHKYQQIAKTSKTRCSSLKKKGMAMEELEAADSFRSFVDAECEGSPLTPKKKRKNGKASTTLLSKKRLGRKYRYRPFEKVKILKRKKYAATAKGNISLRSTFNQTNESAINKNVTMRHDSQLKRNNKTKNTHFDTGKFRPQGPEAGNGEHPLRGRSVTDFQFGMGKIRMHISFDKKKFQGADRILSVPGTCQKVGRTNMPAHQLYRNLFIFGETQPIWMYSDIFLYPCARDHRPNDYIRLGPLRMLIRLLISANDNGQIHIADQNYGRDHGPTGYIHLSDLRNQNERQTANHPAASNRTVSIQRSRNTNRSIRISSFSVFLHINGTRRCLQGYLDMSHLLPSLRLTTQSINHIYRVLTGQNMIYTTCLIEGIPVVVAFEIDSQYDNGYLRLTQSSLERLSLEMANRESADLRTLQNRYERQDGDLGTSFGEANSSSDNHHVQRCLFHTHVSGAACDSHPQNCLQAHADNRHAVSCLSLTEESINEILRIPVSTPNLRIQTEESGTRYFNTNERFEADDNTTTTVTDQNIRDNPFCLSPKQSNLHLDSFDPHNLPVDTNHVNKNPDAAKMGKCKTTTGNRVHVSDDPIVGDSGYTSRQTSSRDQNDEGAVGGYEELESRTTSLITTLAENGYTGSNLGRL